MKIGTWDFSFHISFVVVVVVYSINKINLIAQKKETRVPCLSFVSSLQPVAIANVNLFIYIYLCTTMQFKKTITISYQNEKTKSEIWRTFSSFISLRALFYLFKSFHLNMCVCVLFSFSQRHKLKQNLCLKINIYMNCAFAKLIFIFNFILFASFILSTNVFLFT